MLGGRVVKETTNPDKHSRSTRSRIDVTFNSFSIVSEGENTLTVELIEANLLLFTIKKL